MTDRKIQLETDFDSAYFDMQTGCMGEENVWYQHVSVGDFARQYYSNQNNNEYSLYIPQDEREREKERRERRFRGSINAGNQFCKHRWNINSYIESINHCNIHTERKKICLS